MGIKTLAVSEETHKAVFLKLYSDRKKFKNVDALIRSLLGLNNE